MCGLLRASSVLMVGALVVCSAQAAGGDEGRRVELLSPAPGALLDNGRRDGRDMMVWSFSWRGCPGDEGYHLVV